MPGIKISDMQDGAPALTTDLTVIARGGQNYQLELSDLATALLPTLPLNQVALGSGAPWLTSNPDFAYNPVTGELLLNGSPGAVGEVPTSTGPGSAVAWAPAAGGGLNTASFKVAGVSLLVVPTGVTALFATGAAAGGGGGAGGGLAPNQAGAGGGSGAAVKDTTLVVVPGETLTITIGAGGAATPTGAAPGNGGTGGTTSVVGSFSGVLLTLPGGLGGFSFTDGGQPREGGQGGGGPGVENGTDSLLSDTPGVGGSNLAGGIGSRFVNEPSSPVSNTPACGGGGCGGTRNGGTVSSGAVGFCTLMW